LKEDVKSIISGYYIFAFFRVKISVMVAADRLMTSTEDMAGIYNKLSVRVAGQKSQGKDVKALEVLLSDMQAKITLATSQYQAAEAFLVSLEAKGFPANKSSLSEARAKIKVGSQALRTAFQDAMKIRKGLGDISGNIKPKEASSSAKEGRGLLNQ
jgi:hypothetical protein